jgi:hypothetical protein
MAWFAPDQLTNAPVPDLWAGDSGRFWARRADGRQVDAARTAGLARVDIPMNMPAGTTNAGSTYGQPVQQVGVTAPRFRCLDLRQGWWPFWDFTQRAVIPMPDPGALQIEGGPFDRHWRIIEGNSALWEVWHLQPGGWPWADLQCSSWVRWDLSRPWNQQNATGVVAAGFPHTPLLVRWQDVETVGAMNHGVFLGLDNYNPGRVGPARGSDGTDATHPCRAGEWLRLRADVANRIIATGTPQQATFAQGLKTFGGWVGDRTWWSGQPDSQRVGIIQGTQDTRLSVLGQLRLRLTDFEVVAQ